MTVGGAGTGPQFTASQLDLRLGLLVTFTVADSLRLSLRDSDSDKFQVRHWREPQRLRHSPGGPSAERPRAGHRRSGCQWHARSDHRRDGTEPAGAGAQCLRRVPVRSRVSAVGPSLWRLQPGLGSVPDTAITPNHESMIIRVTGLGEPVAASPGQIGGRGLRLDRGRLGIIVKSKAGRTGS